MPNWKKLIVSGSDAVLNSVTASNGFFGTASYATNALTASFVPLSSLRATGSNYQVQYNNNGFLGATSSFLYNYDSKVLYLTSPDPYPLQVSTDGTDGVYLGGAVNSSTDTGLYSINADQTIAAFDPVSNLYRYSNGFYIYNGGSGIHQFTGSVYISSSLRTDSILNLSNGNTLASYDLSNNTYYYSNQNYTFDNTTNIHSLIGRVVATSISASGGITGSLIGTASWATNASTASFLPIGTYNITSSRAISSSFATTSSYVNNLVPGGDGEILYSNGLNGITATPDFVFNPNRNSVTLDRNEDYNGLTLTAPIDRYAVGHKNTAFTINNIDAYARNYYFVYQIGEGTTGQISRLTAKSGTNLFMYGLKCDYCLTIADPNASPVEITGTRTGVFTCAWDSDGSTTQLKDEVKSVADATFGELVNVAFTVSWAGDDIVVDIDTTGVITSSQIGFMGYFTLFTT